MPRPATSLVLTLVAVSPTLLPGVARADAPSPALRTAPPIPTAWTEPPQTVTAAAVALREACATWSQHVPISPGSDSDVARRRGKSPEAVLCDIALDPLGDATGALVLGAVLAAAAVGVAVGSYATVAAVLRRLRAGANRAAGVVWRPHARRRRGWQE